MANLKNITDLPVAESVEGLNLIVNDNGSAKQIAASAVGAQADFNVTDESHPAFIKNKPEVVQADWAETDASNPAFIKNKPVIPENYDSIYDLIIERISDTYEANLVKGSYESIYNKIMSGRAPTVQCYSFFSYPERNEIDYDIYRVYGIAFQGSEDDRHLTFFISESNDKAFDLNKDNSVEYWEYND